MTSLFRCFIIYTNYVTFNEFKTIIVLTLFILFINTRQKDQEASNTVGKITT